MKKIAHAFIRPTSSLNFLSHREIEGVMNSENDTYDLFRECALAVLNTGSEEDDAEIIANSFKDFDIQVISQSRGIKLEVINAPASAFVDGKMIRGIQDHLFSVLRDIVFTHHKMSINGRFDFESTDGITDAVFRVLRNAGIVQADIKPHVVVCWGGHSIPRHEYDYTKQIGYE